MTKEQTDEKSIIHIDGAIFYHRYKFKFEVSQKENRIHIAIPTSKHGGYCLNLILE